MHHAGGGVEEDGVILQAVISIQVLALRMAGLMSSAHVSRGNGSMGKEIYVSVEEYLIAFNMIFFCCRPVRAAVCADVYS